MTTKIQELISLKKNIDKIQADFNFIKNDDVIVEVKMDIVTAEWIDSGNVLSDSIMKGIPIHDDNNDHTITCFSGPKGSIVKKHYHPHDELIICIKGMLRYVKGDNEHVILNPLESVLVKKNIIHHVEFIENTEILVLWLNIK